jgi:hypothetical protein
MHLFTFRSKFILSAFGALVLVIAPLAGDSSKVRPVSTMTIVDGNGRKVGDMAICCVFNLEVNGKVFPLNAFPSGFQNFDVVQRWFISDGCAGTAYYGFPQNQNHFLTDYLLLPPGHTIWLYEQPQMLTPASTTMPGPCYTIPELDRRPLALSRIAPFFDLDTEFTAPFSIRVSP